MHSIHNLHHHHFFHKEWNPEILEYYFYQTLNKIAHTLVNVFLPIYLFSELKYSLFEIMLFFIIWQISYTSFVPFSSKIIEKIGVKHTIALHIPFMIAFLYLLRFLEPGFWSNIWLIILIPAVRNIPKAFLETAELVFISKNLLAKKHYGVSVAKLRIVLIIASLLAPLFGGVITFVFGFKALFNTAIILYFLSVIPFFMTKDKYFELQVKPKEIINIAMHKLPKPFIYAEFGRVFADSIMWLLWPLFLFIIVANTLDLGILVTVSGIISMLIAYYIGRYVDKFKSEKLVKGSVKVSTGIFYFRTLFADPVLIAIADIINRIFEPVLMVPYEKLIFKYMNSFDDMIEIVNAKVFITEIFYTVGAVVAAIIFFIVSLFGVNQENLFVFIGIFVFFGLSILLMAKICDVDTKKTTL